MDSAGITQQVRDDLDRDFDSLSPVESNVDPVMNSPTEVAKADEGRAARRFTLLIRPAKIISSHGEFVCVVRDVSETGIAVRLFHSVPTGDPLELHMLDGGVYELRMVWERDSEAGFEFTKPIDVGRLIHDASEFPKRPLRLGLYFPIKISSLTGSGEAIVENLSQQGARFESEAKFAIEQNLRIECAEGGAVLKDVRAKVRWRQGNQYGVVFEDTLTLSDFAQFAARLQCPSLLA